MADPDLAMAFSSPKVQAAVMDVSTNPMNIVKYQNDPEVLKVRGCMPFDQNAIGLLVRILQGNRKNLSRFSPRFKPCSRYVSASQPAYDIRHGV